MKILADLHHHDLYYSLQLLLEKRLGAELYRPIGLEWYHEKFWNVYPHIDTAKQYLGLDHAVNRPKDIHGNYLSDREVLNKDYRFEDGIYYVRDTTKNKVQRAITLDKFKEMEFDIIISSIPKHIKPFNRLIEMYQPKAKHVFQVGNRWGKLNGVNNILASTAKFNDDGVNVCYYHQEFDLDTFHYEPPTTATQINSYIHYMRGMDVMDSYKKELTEYSFKTYGAGMDDCWHKSEDIANCMRNSGWTWHYKPGGDGFGHTLHNSFAVGRPAIVQGNFYKNQLAGRLLEDQVTCVDTSKHSVSQAGELIRKFSQPEEHARICENAYNRFKEVVDFDEDEQRIRKFIENLV